MKKIILFYIVFAWLCSYGDYRDEFMTSYGCTIVKEVRMSDYSGVADLILAQAVYESGWGRSGWVSKSNQVFALLDHAALHKKKRVRHWHQYIKHYSDFITAVRDQISYYSRRKYGTTRASFIKNLSRYCPAATCGVKDYSSKIQGVSIYLKPYIEACK